MAALPPPDRLAGMAVAREAPRTPAAGITPETRRLVEDMNRKADDGRWREGVAMARMGPETGQRIAAKNEEIGINYDATTGKKARTRQERARYEEANKWAARNEKFLRVGYDGMDPTPGGEQEQLLADVLAEAALFPVLKAQLDKMNPGQLQAFAERILKEGRLSAEGKQIMDGLLNPERRLLSDGEIFEKQDELRGVELKRDNKNQEVEDLKKQVTAVEQQLNRFARDAAGNPLPTAGDAIEMDRLRGLRASHQAELTTLRRDLGTKQTEFDNLTDEYNAARSAGWTGRPSADVLAERTAARTELDRIKNDVNTREAELQKLTSLEQDHQRLQEQRTTLIKDQRDRELERDTFDLEAKKLQRDLEDKKSVRTSEEMDLVKGYKNLIRESAAKTFEAELQAEAERANTELETLKQQTGDQNEKAMYDAIATGWRGAAQRRMRGGFLGMGAHEETYYPINRALVNTDFATLMMPRRGPEQIGIRLLTTQINSETGRVYTVAEARALINNKEYWDKMRPEVVKHLLAKRATIGGLSTEDISYITDTNWGQEAIQKAFEHNSQLKSNVEAALGQGVLSQGFWPRLGQEFRRHPWWFFLILSLPLAVTGAVRSAQPPPREAVA